MLKRPGVFGAGVRWDSTGLLIVGAAFLVITLLKFFLSSRPKGRNLRTSGRSRR